MLRFNETENIFYIIKENEDKIVSKITKEELEKIKIFSFKDFLNTIHNYLKIFKFNEIFVSIEAEGLLVSIKEKEVKSKNAFTVGENLESKDTFKTVAFYIFENEKIKEVWKKILGKNERTLFSNFSNYFSFIIKKEILNVIFEKIVLEESGKKIYNTFKIKSKSGKVREITAPVDEMKEVLKECNELFQKIFDKNNRNFQVAYKKGKNVVSNAEIHKNNKYVFNMDLKDFFPSCKRELVSDAVQPIFEKILNGDIIKELFLDSILLNNSLFIGNPVSGTLANAILIKPAAAMKKRAENMGMEFSMYADDISFSSNTFIKKEFVEEIFNKTMLQFNLENYFNLNKKKLKGFSKERRKITGVSINSSNELTVPNRRYYRILRAEVHNLSLGKLKERKDKLRGRLAYATMVDETGKIKRLIEKYKDTLLKENILTEERLKRIGIEI